MLPRAVVFSLLFALISSSRAQGSAQLGPAIKTEVVRSLSQKLIEGYVFEDVARKAAERLSANGYVAIGTAAEFAAALQKELREVTGDIHLSVFFDEKMYRELTKSDSSESSPSGSSGELDDARARNFGFAKVEILPSGVGLLELTEFSGYVGGEAGEVATGAMAMLSSSKALIIDLRHNPGGSGRMGQFLSTYFFAPDDEKWLISNVNRSRGTNRQEWTQPYVPGRRLVGTDLYILVGPGTGSAAEGFAYNLQALKRATVVGQPSAGGAHSGSYVPLAGGIVAFIPVGRTVNPITGNNWERVGVQPDHKVDVDKALDQAHLLALEKLASGSLLPTSAVEVEWTIVGLRAKLSPASSNPTLWEEYVGTYASQGYVMKIALEGGKLVYTTGTARWTLRPLSRDTFLVEGADRYGKESRRVRFVRGADGKVVEAVDLIHHGRGQVARFQNRRTP